MKTLAFFIFLLFLFEGLAVEAQALSGDKILVAYFSWSGNAKALAEQVAAETGGVLFEIKTAAPYPQSYDECIDAAKKEQNDNARPALQGDLPDVAPYEVVILCYPNWWGTLPMGVFTFLESRDFSGKTVHPLVTHGGSRFGSSLADIKKLCPRATIGEGLSVSAFDRDPSDKPKIGIPNGDVTAWLAKLALKN
jgi:flavodoxin